MSKDIIENIEVDGKTERAVVLKRGDAGIVYIPVNYLQPEDYARLKKVAEGRHSSLLEGMRREKLNNGRLAINVFEGLIRFAAYPEPEKPSEPVPQILEEKKEESNKDEVEEKPKKRGPGRPPKN